MQYLLVSVLTLITLSFTTPQPTAKPAGDKVVHEITLKCDIDEYVRYLARFSKDTTFYQCADIARKAYWDKNADYFVTLEDMWNRKNPEGKLLDIFRNSGIKQTFSLHAQNPEVLLLISEETYAAVDYNAQILEERLKRLKVKGLEVTPNKDGTIALRFKQVDDLAHVKKVILTRGKVTLWETYTNKELFKSLRESNNAINEVFFKDDLSNQNALMIDLEMPVAEGQITTSPVLGSCAPADTARIMEWLSHPKVRKSFPPKTRLLWSAHPNKDGMITLHAMKTERQHVEGKNIEKATQGLSGELEQALLIMEMDDEGKEAWYWVTSKNVGRYITVEMDEEVYGTPKYDFAIANGKAAFDMSGDTITEQVARAKYLANIMTSEAFPVGVRIIKEETITE